MGVMHLFYVLCVLCMEIYGYDNKMIIITISCYKSSPKIEIIDLASGYK